MFCQQGGRRGAVFADRELQQQNLSIAVLIGWFVGAYMLMYIVREAYCASLCLLDHLRSCSAESFGYICTRYYIQTTQTTTQATRRVCL